MLDRHTFFVSDPDFENLIRQHQPPEIPPVLYHYTDAAGLKGIIESRTLWLTHFQHTNDFTEVRHGIRCAIAQLEASVSASNPSDVPVTLNDCLSGRNPNLKPGDALIQVVLATLQTPEIEARSRYRYFLASFSEHGDQLSQWRAYAHDASGFSIGFSYDVLRSSELIRQLSEDDLGDTIDLLKVIYDRGEQERIIASLITEAYERTNSMIPTLPIEKRHDALIKMNVWLTASFLRIALLFKHHGFKEEDEWRLVLCKSDPDKTEKPTANPVRTRNTEYGIAPYVAIPLCGREQQLKLQHLIAGPKCGLADAAGASSTFGLEILCRELEGGTPVNGISLSATPYR